MFRSSCKTLAATAALALVVSAVADDRARVISADSDDIQWGPCPGFFPETCRIGVLNGSPAEPRADIFFKVPAGTALPKHTHTSAERMVLISGALNVEYDGQDAAVIETGDYAYGPPGHPHSARCLDHGECVLFIAFNEPVDAMPVEAD